MNECIYERLCRGLFTQCLPDPADTTVAVICRLTGFGAGGLFQVTTRQSICVVHAGSEQSYQEEH